MLIVTADDFGFSPTVTDPIVAAFDEGVISSSSAMVWMRDSERAAELARERGIPLGLHLNLTFEFRDERAPLPARELQAQLVSVFDRTSWHEGDDRPQASERKIREAIAYQLDAFRAVYGEPTHIDGHHHVHVNAAVLACLPPELPIRPVIRTPAELSRRPTARDRSLHKRLRAPDACVSFRHIHPALGGAGLSVLGYADRHSLDVMAHPRDDGELDALRSSEWREALGSLTVGSYRDLDGATSRRSWLRR